MLTHFYPDSRGKRIRKKKKKKEREGMDVQVMTVE